MSFPVTINLEETQMERNEINDRCYVRESNVFYHYAAEPIRNMFDHFKTCFQNMFSCVIKYLCGCIECCFLNPIWCCFECFSELFRVNPFCGFILLLFICVAMPIIIATQTMKHNSPTFKPTLAPSLAPSLSSTYMPSLAPSIESSFTWSPSIGPSLASSLTWGPSSSLRGSF